jgi:hypothetical protein
MKQGATAAKREALDRMEEGLLNQAQQEITNARTMAESRQQQLESWAMDTIGRLETAKIELSQNYGFNPQELTANIAQGGMDVARQVAGDPFINPLARRREDEF